MIKDDINEMVARAVRTYRQTVLLNSHEKRECLELLADAFEAREEQILAANRADTEAAAARGRPERLIDRIRITDAQLDKILRQLRVVADFADPIGTRHSRWVRPNGLEIQRVRVPVGVIGVCCESRPFVFPIAAAACLKTNNVLVHVSDTECPRTLEAFMEAIHDCEQKPAFPVNGIQIYTADNHTEACRYLTSLDRQVNLAILRGTQSFVADIVEHARVPVLKRSGRLCHVFVDGDHVEGEGAARVTRATDLPMAVDIAISSRCDLPDSCTAASIVLVHESIASRFLPMFHTAAVRANLQLRADPRAIRFLPGSAPTVPADFTNPAPERDCLTVGIVDSLSDAILQINKNGSALSDAIVTGSPESERRFLASVESAAVYANCATNFTSGSEFGMGVDIGISTDKLDVRGPIGLEALTSLKFLVRGDGQVRGGH